MQFKNLALFSLLGGVLAQSGTLATLNAGFANIGTALGALDTAVGTITDGNAEAQTQALVGKSGAVAAAIKKATADLAAASTPLTLGEATQLAASSNTLLQKTESTVNGLIAKKSIIAKNGKSSVVKQQLTEQKNAADGLVGAITAKVPAVAVSIAKSQAGKITAAIQKGVAAFS